MKACKYCGEPLEWAWDEQRKIWIPLEPLETTQGLRRTFVDENGVLRARHNERCTNPDRRFRVTRLDKPIPAEIADNHGEFIQKNRRRKATKSNANQEAMDV